MNRRKLSSLFGSLALLLVATAMLQPAMAQQQNPAQPPSTQQDLDRAASSAMSQPAGSQTFMGKVSKAGGQYVLKDTTAKVTYLLDDQDRAKQFEDQNVKVTGKLDARTNTIQIAAIEPGS